MNVVGLICEYNPFHLGHLYHLKKAKELFPDSIFVLVINGYFLERGEVSVLSKEQKTRAALRHGVDLVLELPVVFGTQSADTFAYRSIEILNHFGVTDIVFGSECHDIDALYKIAWEQLNRPNYHLDVQEGLKQGLNYPTALNKALLEGEVKLPNDLLGLSYIKAILAINSKILPHTIKRTNDYHGKTHDGNILSASAIRTLNNQGEDVSNYVPNGISDHIKKISLASFYPYLRYKILTEHHLDQFFSMDEGIENRVLKAATCEETFEGFFAKLKTKRYTFNKLQRLLVHLLLGLTKEDHERLTLAYVRILGMNKIGQAFLKDIRNTLTISTEVDYESLQYHYERVASLLYQMISDEHILTFEEKNKPIF